MRSLLLMVALTLSILGSGCSGGNKITKGEKEFKATEAADSLVKVPTNPIKLPPDVQKKVEDSKKSEGKLPPQK